MTDNHSHSTELETGAITKFATVLKKSKGILNILVNDSPIFSISLADSKVMLDIHDTLIFGNIDLEKEDSNEGVLQKLKTARRFGEILNNNGLSLTILRKGKKAFTIGRDATPTLSSIITGSDDIQIDSVTQVAKLGQDVSKIKKQNKMKD
jgi:hypothetical protein